MMCGCPGASPLAGGRVWHLHPVPCSDCGAAIRSTYVTDGGLHLCPPCARGDKR